MSSDPSLLSRNYPTLTLYDPGEESWGVKVHCGCGGIYLTDSGTGYVNIDIQGDLAAEYPDRVRENTAGIRNYYARLDGDYVHLPSRRQTVADWIGDFIDPPFAPATVDKIVCIQALEHLAPYDVEVALTHWWNALKPGGVLIVSVPDMSGTLKWLDEPNTHDFAVRQLHGSARDCYNVHRAWFNRLDLMWLLRRSGFDRIIEIPSFHLYPAIVVRAQKADLFVPDRSYQSPLPEYDPATCVGVLDVGPGSCPLSIATRCFDVSDQNRGAWHVPFDVGNVEALPYRDNEWDYVYASHVVEHTEHPVQAVAELMRVGKRGFIEVPSVMLDWLMQHGGAHQNVAGKPARWMCLPLPNGIVFVERDDMFLPAFTDREFGKWAMRVTHYKIALSGPERYLRDMFWRTQKFLNVQAAWNENRRVLAVEVRANGDVVRDWFPENVCGTTFHIVR